MYTYIVTGLPRSGTSVMFKMLKVGGMEILTDDIPIPKGWRIWGTCGGYYRP